MVIWSYDGTAAGFWTLVARSYTDRVLPDEIGRLPSSQRSLLGESLVILTDRDLADRAGRAFAQKAGQGAYDRVMDALRLTHNPPVLEALFFVRVGFKDARALRDLRCESNRRIGQAAAFVYKEAHRWIGFARFAQWEEGTLYAPIGPKADILDLIAPHFATRMVQERWIIHDRTHKRALLGENGEYQCVTVQGLHSPVNSASEGAFAALWKGFFEAVSIESRLSPKRQRQLVPRRFEPYMTEMIGC